MTVERSQMLDEDLVKEPTKGKGRLMPCRMASSWSASTSAPGSVGGEP